VDFLLARPEVVVKKTAVKNQDCAWGRIPLFQRIRVQGGVGKAATSGFAGDVFVVRVLSGGSWHEAQRPSRVDAAVAYRKFP
jgi:hypothetical protein